MRTTLTALLAGSLLGGCVHVVREPALEFPPIPVVRFQCTGGFCCLTEADTNTLNRWAKAVREFQAARERLLEAR